MYFGVVAYSYFHIKMGLWKKKNSPKELHLNFNFKFQEHMNTDICQ